MSLKFYLGASGSGKSYQLYKDINQMAKDNPDRNYLFLVPDQYTIQAQKDLVNASDSKGILNIDVLSFNRLAHRIFEETGYMNKTVLDDTGKSLILRKIASDIANEMPVIGHNLNKIGYIHEIKSVISEFKQYGVDDDKIAELINYSSARGLLCAKLKDIKTIYKEFNNYINEKYVTSEESLTILTEAVEKSKIVENSVIVFDGFTGFTPIQYKLIQNLMRLTKQVIVSVTVDIDSEPYGVCHEEELFYLSKKTIKDLQTLAMEVNVPLDDDVVLATGHRFTSHSDLKHLERHLFRYPIKGYINEPNNIKIYVASDVDEEVKNACYLIKSMALSGEYQYRDIAVVCGDIEAYADRFIFYSSVYDIPIFVDRNKKLMLNPFVELLRSALYVVKDNFSYQSVFHLLKSGMVPFSEDEIDRLDNYVLSYGIKGRSKYEEAFTKIPGKAKNSGEITSEQVNELNELNELRERFINMMTPILNKSITAKDYAISLTTFIEVNDFESSLLKYRDYFIENDDRLKASEYGRVYGLIKELLDQITDLLSDSSIDIEEFIKIFESGVDEIDVGNIPGGIDRVIIGDIVRSRIAAPKVMFFVGVNDGNIPKANQKGGLISDYDREYLKDSDIALSPTPKEQMFTQRLYLYMNMTKPSEKLYLSYAKSSNDGKSMKESYLIGLLSKLFPLIKIKETDVIQKPFDSILGCKDGLLLYADGIRDYSEGVEGKIALHELLSLKKVLSDDPQYKEYVEKITDSAFFRYEPKAIGRDLANALYGTILSNSVSRLEKYFSCEYAHFLQYGMKLTKRDEPELQNNDLGNIYHSVIEDFSNRLTQNGYSWVDYPEAAGEKMLEDAVNDVCANYAGSLMHNTYSYESMIERIKQMMKRSAKTIREQLEGSLFRPENFEKSFKISVPLDNDAYMNLKGRIDRIDICRQNDRLLVKVVDYKSGNVDLELDSLFYGLQMQQPLYMKRAIEMVSSKYEDAMPKMAAMLYFHIDNPVIESDFGDNGTDYETAVLDAMRPNGVINSDMDVLYSLDKELKEGAKRSHLVKASIKSDGTLSEKSKTLSDEDFEIINGYLDSLIKEAGNEMLKGNIKVNPYRKKDKDACKYCDYKDICAFDERREGYEYRMLKDIDDETVIERMKECL